MRGVLAHSDTPIFHHFLYVGDAWKALVDAAGAMLPDNQETLSSLTKFVDQLPSVLNEVSCWLGRSHSLMLSVLNIGE